MEENFKEERIEEEQWTWSPAKILAWIAVVIVAVVIGVLWWMNANMIVDPVFDNTNQNNVVDVVDCNDITDEATCLDRSDCVAVDTNSCFTKMRQAGKCNIAVDYLCTEDTSFDRCEDLNCDTYDFDEEITWQTYNDSRYNFSFDYPETWYAYGLSELEEYTVIISSDMSNSDDDLWGIEIYDLSDIDIEGITAEAYINLIIDNTGSEFSPYRDEVRKNVEFNGIEALEVIVTMDEEGPEILSGWYQRTIIFEHEDTIFVFSNNNVKEFDDIFTSIYQSFKFTDQESDWQTYENTDYGFSFDYSSDYITRIHEYEDYFIVDLAIAEDSIWMISIKVKENVDNQSLDQLVEEGRRAGFEFEITDVIISGQEGKKYSRPDYDGYGNTAAIVIFEDNIFTIEGNDKPSDLKSIFEKTLSSFQFTDQESDWQTYENIWDPNHSGPGGQLDIAFQFDYPNNWQVTGDGSGRYLRPVDGSNSIFADIYPKSKESYDGYKYHNPDSFISDYIVHEAMYSCEADGHGGSVHCEEALIVEQGVSDHGITYHKLGMTEVSIRVENDWQEEKRYRGPVYALEVSEFTNGEYEIIFLSPRGEGIGDEGLNDIFIGIVNSFQFTDQEEDIGDTQTYINQEYSISLNYPMSFYMQEESSEEVLFDSDEGHFWFRIADNEDNLDAQGIMDFYYANDGYGYQYEDSFVTIADINSYKQGRYDLGIIENYFIPSGDQVFNLSFEFNFDENNTELFDEYSQIISDIINSFVFIY